VLIALLITGFCVFSIWFGLQYMDRTQYQSTPATQISFAWIYLALPLGMAMTLIHWLLIVRHYIARREFASDAHFDATASASL
jgi:TRAP-type C4-dicarboxylate transport system permease small subunit